MTHSAGRPCRSWRRGGREVSKDCLTCKWEPHWSDLNTGRCRFPVSKKLVAGCGLPPGTQIATPWMDRDKPKQRCPAWVEKEEA